MHITLPPEAQAIINREIESGRFETEQDVIVEALKHLDDDQFAYDPMSDPKVIEAIAQMERGDTRELTEEVWSEIRAQSEADAWNGVPISDDVKY